jgi:hypothetical protein
VSGPPLGVMLFSLGGLFWRDRLGLAEGLERVAALGPGQGIELIGAQSLPSYPEVPEDDVRAVRDAIDRTGVVPVAYCAYVERARSASRVLTPLETLPLVAAELRAAQRLGFPMLRLNTATPELLRALAPVAERAGVDVVVELATEPRTDPAVRGLLDELDALGCARLGVIQDFSAFVRAIPAPFLDAAVAEGTPEEAARVIADTWAAGAPVGDAVQTIAGLPGLSDGDRRLALTTAYTAAALFRPGDPEGLLDVLPHLRHVQAKFFALDGDDREPCIPYDELLPLLRDGGYTGRVHSEFEGFLWSDDLDTLDQLARHQRMVTRLWSAG